MRGAETRGVVSFIMTPEVTTPDMIDDLAKVSFPERETSYSPGLAQRLPRVASSEEVNPEGVASKSRVPSLYATLTGLVWVCAYNPG